MYTGVEGRTSIRRRRGRCIDGNWNTMIDWTIVVGRAIVVGRGSGRATIVDLTVVDVATVS